MNKEKAIEELNALKGNGDPEYAHAKADEILLEVINDQAIRAAYDHVPKWYA
jgi:hypothetical protein